MSSCWEDVLKVCRIELHYVEEVVQGGSVLVDKASGCSV